MIAILSPAKRLNTEPEEDPKEWSLPHFLEGSQELVSELRKYDVDGLKKLMNVSDQLAELNHQRFAEWNPEFSPNNARRALLAFQGDVYQGLGAEEFSGSELEFAQEHLRILSGLYGVLRPLDLIQPYRLEMSTKLPNSEGEDLYSFWRDRLTATMKEDLKDSSQGILVDLASNEYSKVLDKKELGGNVITPKFMEKRDGKFKTLPIKAKRARGLMARFMVREKIESPESLQAFDYEGYRYNEGMSDKKRGVWAFTKVG